MNKQIEEMAHLVCERDAEDICTLDRKRCDMKCTSGDIAKHLYSHGYRKSTDVAREIMREVRQALLNMVLANSMGETYDIEKCFAEIEKKYESEGT